MAAQFSIRDTDKFDTFDTLLEAFGKAYHQAEVASAAGVTPEALETLDQKVQDARRNLISLVDEAISDPS